MPTPCNARETSARQATTLRRAQRDGDAIERFALALVYDAQDAAELRLARRVLSQAVGLRRLLQQIPAEAPPK